MTVALQVPKLSIKETVHLRAVSGKRFKSNPQVCATSVACTSNLITGISVGLGYQYTADNGVFIRAEVSASEYDDVNATSEVDTSKEVEVTEMYGAVGSIKVGKSF